MGPPDRVHKLAARDHPVRAGRKHREHRALPGLARGDLAIPEPPRHRAEYPHSQRLHGQPVPFSARVMAVSRVW